MNNESLNETKKKEEINTKYSYYLKDRIATFLTFAFCFIFSLIFIWSFNLKFSDFKDIILTWISMIGVFFGFSMTAISVLFGSEYIKKLKVKKDPESIKLSALERFTGYYTIQIKHSIESVLYGSLYYIVMNSSFKKNSYLLNPLPEFLWYCSYLIVTALIFSFLIINMWHLKKTLTLFLNAFLDSSNIDDQKKIKYT